MITRVVFTICFSMLVIISFSQKQGLIIGIGNYPKESKWPNLSSVNDVKYVKATLSNLGFSKEQITILKDQEATREKILEAIKTLSSKVVKNDLVYIHFSGHGQQIVDDNNDEIDQLDEAIVPYDSPMHFIEGTYEGENLIRDDEINLITDQIRNKIGPKGQLIYVMDACHSGTGTRGYGKARGTNIIMGASSKQLTKDKRYGFKSIKNEKDMAPMASFFGSSAHELNFETFDSDYNSVGSLTYAISDVLSNLKEKCTFQDLFDLIKHKMVKLAPNQNPQWEGPKDILIFENTKVKLDDWINVKNHLSKEDMIISTGSLNGVFKGSSVEIYDFDTRKVISTGSVVNSQLLSCIVRLKTELPLNPNTIYKAKVSKTSSPPCQVKINSQLSENDDWNSLVSEIDQNAICSFTENNADLYLANCGNGENLIQLSTKEGNVIYEGKNPRKKEKHLYKINQLLKEYAIGQYIRNYEFKNSELNFDVQVVPMHVEKNRNKIISEKELSVNEKLADDGFLHFKNGDYIKIKVTNLGSKAGYFSILDIQGDNKINFVVPSIGDNRNAEDFYLKPGGSYETDFLIRIAPPFGNELIKLIASDVPLDLSAAFGGTLSRGPSELHPFEDIIHSLSSKTRSSSKALNINQLGTDDFVFKIVD